LICSIRTEIPYPCIGSSANVFFEHIERALDEITWLVWHKPSSPWLPRGTYASSTGCQEEKTPKFMRKRPENSWRQANSQGIWRKFGAKTESNMGTKNRREAGMGTWPLGFRLLSFCYACLRFDDFNVVRFWAGRLIAVHFGLQQLRPDACGALCGIDLVPV